MGQEPFDLGHDFFVTSTGVTFYLHLPSTDSTRPQLMALERDHFVALVHRDLPLGTLTSIPGVSLAVLHLESAPDSAPELAKGHVDRAWLSSLASSKEANFVNEHYLVAATRSTRFRIAAVAAVPIAYLHERTRTLAWRLVPASLLIGLALMLAVASLARQQRSITAALRHAMKRKEFYLQYQPIVELATGRCIGAEALLRWRRSTGEQIGPDLFIPIAEQSGFITKLTERVLELTQEDAGDFLSAHPEFHIALNLSAKDLHSTAIVDLIDKFLRRSGARPSNLIVEITERGFLDMASAVRVIGALRSRGIEVAIDDFGTGYSSLSYLASLDLDFLKIDRSFIEAIGTGAPTSQVVGHIIAMARMMGLRMIAEGIESESQAEFLREHKVQYAQGWLYGKPMSFKDIARRVAAEQAGQKATMRAA
jgi:sensor c-di-GMP phosphodiesterase-like protein